MLIRWLENWSCQGIVQKKHFPNTIPRGPEDKKPIDDNKEKNFDYIMPFLTWTTAVSIHIALHENDPTDCNDLT